MYVLDFSDNGNPIVYVPGPQGEGTEYTILTAEGEVLDRGELEDEMVVEVEPGSIIRLQFSGQVQEFVATSAHPDDIKTAAQSVVPGIRLGI